MKGYGPIPKICEVCQDPYLVKACREESARFCSIACTQEARKAGVVERGSRSKHHRIWTPEEDAIVRAHYLDKKSAGVAGLLRARSPAAIKERARRLGLSRTVRLWTEEEEAWLMAHSSQPLAKLRKRLKRGTSAIYERLYRLGGSRKSEDHYTGTQAALVLGVDSHKIEQWVSGGRLKATKLEHVGREDRGTWQIRPADLRQFVSENRTVIDVRMVDKHSFLDLVLGPPRGYERLGRSKDEAR